MCKCLIYIYRKYQIFSKISRYFPTLLSSDYYLQGFHTLRVLEFFLRSPGPEVLEMSLVLENPGIYMWFKSTNMPFVYRTACVDKDVKCYCCVLTEVSLQLVMNVSQ